MLKVNLVVSGAHRCRKAHHLPVGSEQHRQQSPALPHSRFRCSKDLLGTYYASGIQLSMAREEGKDPCPCPSQLVYLRSFNPVLSPASWERPFACPLTLGEGVGRRTPGCLSVLPPAGPWQGVGVGRVWHQASVAPELQVAARR